VLAGVRSIAPIMRCMNALTSGLLVFPFALAVACMDDDGTKPADATGGVAGALSSAGGNTPGLEAGGGGVGNSAGASDANAEARRALCETVCKTEAELPCALEPAACLKGWCDDPVEFLLPCIKRWDALLSCVAAQPVEAFECLPDGVFPKEETCADEQAMLLSCVQS
jgi:hypothetical protein